jgi:hypothetical protein
MNCSSVPFQSLFTFIVQKQSWKCKSDIFLLKQRNVKYMSVNKVYTSSSASTVCTFNEMKVLYINLTIFILNFTYVQLTTSLLLLSVCYHQVALYSDPMGWIHFQHFWNQFGYECGPSHGILRYNLLPLSLVMPKFQWIYTMCQKHIG